MFQSRLTKSFIKGGFTVIISVLIIFTVVKAGTITPSSGEPTAQFYTLTDIYNRLYDNSEAVLGDHSFTFSDAFDGTHYTLKQIYDRIPTINPTKVLFGTSYLGIAGTIETKILSATSETVGAGYYATTTLSSFDTDLAVGKIKSGTTIFGFAGDYPSATYALPGDTASSDAAAAQICNTYEAWTKAGALITGTITVDATKVLTGASYCGTDGIMADNTSFGLTCGAADQAVTAGYYSGGTLSGDAYLVAANIKSGVNIFGVAGSAVVVDYSLQWLQTKDDNLAGDYTAEEAAWTTATTTFTGANSIDYADTGADSARTLDLYGNTVAVDGRSGLWWTDIAVLDGGTTATTTTNNFTLTADGSRPTAGNAISFCNALNTYNSNAGFGGYTDWYLPTQKELMQAYIDGSSNNLLRPGNIFWSSTENSGSTATAWIVYLAIGDTYRLNKLTSRNYVRCVRRP